MTKKASLYLICGTDEYVVAAQARKLVDELCPPAQQALGLEMIEARCDSAGDAEKAIRTCLSALQTVGFFDASKLVWLKNANFFSDAGPGRSEDVRKALAELTTEIDKGLMAGQTLVISADKVDRRMSFFKVCKEKGELREHNVPEKAYQAEQQAREVVEQAFKERRLHAPYDAIEAFLGRCGTDTRAIMQEIEKLDLFVGTRRDLTVNDVRAVVSVYRETASWDLADAFGKRDLRNVLQVLRQLIAQKEAPMGLIAGLEGRIRELLIFKECLNRRWLRVIPGRGWSKIEWIEHPDADAALSKLDTDPRAIHPFRAGKLAEQAAQFSSEELVRCHHDITETHEKMVSNPTEPALLLEFALIKMLGGTDARRAVSL